MPLRSRLISALLLAPLGFAWGSGAIAQDETITPPAPPKPVQLDPVSPPLPASPAATPQAPTPLNRETQALSALAEQQYSEGQFAEAQQTLEKLLAKQRRPEEQAETLNLLGLVHDRQGQFDPAAAAYQKALASYANLKASQPQVAKQGEARTLNNLGALYASEDRVNEALGFLERSLSIFRELKVRESEAVTLRNLGSLYLRANRGDDAITALESSLKIETDLNRPVQVVELLDRLSSLYLAAGATNEALVTLQKAFTIVESSNDLSSKLALLTRMAQLFEGTRRPDKAIETYQQALELVKKTPKDELGASGPRLEARLRDRIARVFADSGENQRALAQYEKVLAIATDLDDPLGQAQILTTMGDLQRRSQALEPARESYTQALALIQPLNRPVAEGRLLSGLAVVARDGEQWSEALDFAKQALAAQEKPVDGEAERSLQNAGKAVTLNLLGDLYRHEKQYEPAAAAYQQSLAALKASESGQQAQPNLLLRGTNLTNLGEMLLAVGRAEDAVQPLQQAVSLWEALGLESAEGQGRNPVSLSYQRLTDALIAQGDDGAALATVEQWRSRLYRTFLDLRQPTQAPPVNSLNLQQIQRVAVDQNAMVLVYDFADGLNDNPQAVNFEPAGSQALVPQQLRIWQLSPQGELKRKTVSLGEEQQQVLRSLSRQNKVSGAALKSLGTLFLDPIRDGLPKDADTTVILIPPSDFQGLGQQASGPRDSGQQASGQQGITWQKIPWAALPLDGETFLDRHALSVLPTVQLLATAPASPLDGTADRPSGAPLIVGNPALPNGKRGTAVEEQVVAIADLLGVEALTGTGATLEAIAPQFAQAQLIHLAVPQLNVEGVGEALAFASNGELRGMTPADILALKLQADLVVLHGLDGNLDKPSPTELSLAQAFRAAGAPAVLSSTGLASEAATRDLMKAFYPGLQDDLSPAQALRQAMLKLRQQYPEPSDWASFILVGGATPIQWQSTGVNAADVNASEVNADFGSDDVTNSSTEAVSPTEAANPTEPTEASAPL